MPPGPEYSSSSMPYLETAWTSGALSTQFPDLPLIHPPPTGPSSLPGMWVICQGNPTPHFSCLCACQHAGMCMHQGLSPGISQTMSPVQTVPDKSVSVALLMLVAVHWKLGHSGHGNLSHPSARCDAHAIQHRAAFVPPSPKHLCVHYIHRHSIQWRHSP